MSEPGTGQDWQALAKHHAPTGRRHRRERFADRPMARLFAQAEALAFGKTAERPAADGAPSTHDRSARALGQRHRQSRAVQA